MKKAIGAFLFYRVFGWKCVGDIPKDVKKCVVIGGPHTSNFDFILAVTMMWSKRWNIKILGKKELFKPGIGWIFRAMGVVPIDRHSSNNAVESAAKLFEDHEEFIVALSPEGTRKKVERFRSGFYYIAKAAQVPVVMIGVKYNEKLMTIETPYYLTEDKDADFKHFYQFFNEQKGKYADKDFDVEI